MGELYRRLRGWGARWRVVKVRSDRIMVAIAEDQLLGWAVRPEGRRRTQAMKGWGDMLRSFA